MFDKNFLLVGKSIGKEKDWIKKKIRRTAGGPRGLLKKTELLAIGGKMNLKPGAMKRD
jgi:hypothetical protein